MTTVHLEMDSQFKEISSAYLGATNLFSDQLQTDLKVFVKQFKEKLDQIIAEEKTLKIGIVGEVKAGKSSFLNALLFEGKKVLPEAPTPMTAALTKIGYSEKMRAEVFFYSRKDWETIEELSLQYDREAEKLTSHYKEMKRNNGSNNPFSRFKQGGTATEEVRVTEEEINLYINERISEEKIGCKELTQLVKKHGINVDQYLDQSEIVAGVESIEDLVGKLNYYVGSDGVLTPIVKSTNIYLDIPTLKDLEIIDTPGTNDPIVSRGLVTRKYLAQCDAIFLLSNTGQFMKSQDVEFIVNTLPSEGIRKGIIVGSKFDSALLNTKPGSELKHELLLLRRKLTNYAQHVIDEELKNNPGNITLQSLKEYLPPEFISSVAYNIAVKDGQDLNELEQHVLERLQLTFKGFSYNQDLFMQLSNIERIKEREFKSIVAQKEEILEHKLADTLTGQKQKFKNLLESIHSEVASRLDNITNYDGKQLEEKHDLIMSKLKDASSSVEYIFDLEIIAVKKKIKALQQDLREELEQYNDLKILEGSNRTFSHSKRKWVFWKEDVYTNTSYQYARVNQVIDNISKLIVDFQRQIMNVFSEIVDSRELRKQLKTSILSLFDLQDGNFKENEILNPIEVLLNNLTVSEFELDSSRYEEMISSAFAGSTVKNEDIHKLARKQQEVLSAVVRDTIKLLDEESKKIAHILKRESKQFTNNVGKSISGVLHDLQSQLASRESYIKQYESLLVLLKNDLRKLG